MHAATHRIWHWPREGERCSGDRGDLAVESALDRPAVVHSAIAPRPNMGPMVDMLGVSSGPPERKRTHGTPGRR